MRLAILSWESLHSIAVGGLAAHVSELADALVRRGHDVHVFTRMGQGQHYCDCVNGVHYHRCPVPANPNFVEYIETMCDAMVQRVRETERFFGERFDVIHGHDWLVSRALVKIKNDLNRPVLMTLHSTEYGRCGNEFRNGISPRIRHAEWEGSYVAQKVVCVSRALRDEVAWLYQVPQDKMEVIYNGVEVNRFDIEVDASAVRKGLEIDSGDPFVLFAGRLAWQKGPDMLVDAIPRVLHSHPNTKFVLAGDGDMREGLERQVRGHGIAHATRFAGYRSGRDLVKLFKSSDAVCVPSRNEPFGIVILEAWSAGKPVIATRSGGPAEFVSHRHTGLTVKIDTDAIREGLDETLDDLDNARRMGRNGRHEVETAFTWDIIASQTQDIYQSIC